MVNLEIDFGGECGEHHSLPTQLDLEYNSRYTWFQRAINYPKVQLLYL